MATPTLRTMTESDYHAFAGADQHPLHANLICETEKGFVVVSWSESDNLWYVTSQDGQESEEKISTIANYREARMFGAALVKHILA